MIKEKSCGAIVYKIENSKLYILLLKHNMGHWSYPKGHVEGNETEIETALREIKEETNLDVKLDNDFRKVVTYSPKTNILKDVVYFVATPVTDCIKVQKEEISEISWYECEEAKKVVTYDNDRMILNEVIKHLIV